MKKIFITGGSGVLGSRLVSYLQKEHSVYAPTREQCDILNTEELIKSVEEHAPDIVIHLAALVDTFKCEEDVEQALDTNVIGTVNIAKACSIVKSKLIYISSEYVFGGSRGDYSVADRLDPINIYGKTKAAAEYIASTVPSYQIIRAPFIKRIHPEVFVDQYCTRYFLEDVVDKIIHNILYNQDTIVHIAPSKDTLYNTYIKKGYNPTPIHMDKDQLKVLPRDTSLVNQSI